ncbi:enoyl-CoA hydratase/isomerase family protein [Amycolatopsis acidiphila]|uniref:Enoyl-CoA hydratase/isomerase family protein n=2 Tax=Amycolatopsis acidiphila TaxID=715473 RepID=A0A558AI20_9PSEU|nr:enoyl-CoA hydratase/isomerase family protein [Amycolatopsis acidiphila]TVT23841.1 enoyl-CoA hydratase/isomerase family protein [Amycolatopsis acidiphila]UIJ63766.1 enoyl-CoA hydratase/isomerase family protein [Amycolatopsis acidiphila]GHG86254.1 short-chain-enoyl-CoA hydratase [Amycolatopsis acidiphila]
MGDHQYLITSIGEGVGVIQLNHPRKRNALGWELHREIIAVLGEWAEDDRVAAVLLVGNEDYFCAGWALDVLEEVTGDDLIRFNDLACKLMVSLYDYRKPTVAAVAGVAPGYGMDLANMCDITVASENAMFGSTQVKYAMNGFYHGMLRKVGAQRARRMLFTGDPIDAKEALRIGLVDELVPVGTVRESGFRLARHIAEAGPELATVLKEVALRASNMDHIGATAYELRVTADLIQRGLFTRRLSEGLAALRSGQSKATARLRS